jgi:predicted enzyme related to lactoylglutathione lyase
MQRVIGLGGPFLKSKDPKTLAAWYEKHLGIPFNGSTYVTWQQGGNDAKAFNIFSFFKEDSGYFAPSEKPVMINFVVEDLFALIEVLRTEGVEIVGEPSDSEYGKFGWILDPEGNKVELWQA